jgi:hypothetical protein
MSHAVGAAVVHANPKRLRVGLANHRAQLFLFHASKMPKPSKSVNVDTLQAGSGLQK